MTAAAKRATRQAVIAKDNPAHEACGCTVDDTPRKAVAVDPDIKRSNMQRLRRIEGQIRGLQKMIEEERYCADIVIQIASVQEALRGVGRALMRNHLEHCSATAIRSGDQKQAAQQYEELLELIFKHLR